METGTTPKAHRFPLIVGKETLELLQGTMFFLVLADTAAGITVQSPTGVAAVEERMRSRGYTEKVISQGWELLQNHRTRFESSVFQAALLQMRGQWDWFSRRIRDFAVFALKAEGAREPHRKVKQDLRRIDRLTVGGQIALYERLLECTLDLAPEQHQLIRESELVRNLGMHNRWEVDAEYLDKTARRGWHLGQMREFSSEDLTAWHAATIEAVSQLALVVATRFRAAPGFPTGTLVTRARQSP